MCLRLQSIHHQNFHIIKHSIRFGQTADTYGKTNRVQYKCRLPDCTVFTLDLIFINNTSFSAFVSVMNSRDSVITIIQMKTLTRNLSIDAEFKRASCRQCIHGKYRSVRDVLRFVLYRFVSWDILGVVHVKAISSLYCSRRPVCFWPRVLLRVEQKLEKLNVSFSQIVYQINRFLVVNFMILSR